MTDYRNDCIRLQQAFLYVRSRIFEKEGVYDISQLSTRCAPLTAPSLCLEIATRFHAGQLDKAGRPYINHPRTVASFFLDPNLQCIALLHDVIEDTPCKASMLLQLGVDKRIVDSVVYMTRSSGVTYDEYLQRLVKNRWACYVKLADLSHNMDLSRLSVFDAKVLKRCTKYVNAITYLANTVWGCNI